MSTETGIRINDIIIYLQINDVSYLIWIKLGIIMTVCPVKRAQFTVRARASQVRSPRRIVKRKSRPGFAKRRQVAMTDRGPADTSTKYRHSFSFGISSSII